MANKKIEEWIKEIEKRPASAPVILNYIANRLQDLTNRNEELLAEVIALQSGNRVEEYERRIAYLEYQLDLIKRGIKPIESADADQAAGTGTTRANDDNLLSLLIYEPNGSVMRIDVPVSRLDHGMHFINIEGLPEPDPELPRMLAVEQTEELLFLFTTGRIATMPLASIPLAVDFTERSKQEWPKTISWDHAAVPVPPRTSEKLACILPISELYLADNFIQVSRRGFLKKIRISMAEGILQNRYIGMGVHKPPDRTFDLLLTRNEDRVALLTWEGYFSIYDVDALPVSLGQVQRLTISDHLVRILKLESDKSVLVMTNIGKLIHLTNERLQTIDKIPAKGQPLFSTLRREEGVRVVDAVCVAENDICCVLERSGCISFYYAGKLSGAGTVKMDSEILAFCTMPG